MTIWAIVPVKPLRRGKSRLASVLSEEDRTKLNRKLLSHTLETLKSIPEIGDVLVVSRDAQALSLARDHKARTLLEDGAPHLNVALERATQVAKSYMSQSVLIVPADLPQISAEDVRKMLAQGKKAPVIVIAPDHRNEGTNALYVNPAGIIDYDFGEGSFQRHRERALDAGIDLQVCELPSLAHDVDLPEDLEFLSMSLEELVEE
jgi:2-phospho-L-lactate guanylyltransferase